MEWASKHGHTITICKPYLGDGLIDRTSDFDGLIIMGGPMGVHDTHSFPWLHDEIALILESIEENKKILGICLGSQLIARALGSPVFKNSHKEMGWFPVVFNTAKFEKELKLKAPESIHAFHWHGEAFDLPYGAESLAQTDATKCQAYLYQKNVLGLLCHFEVTPKSVQEILEHNEDELVEGKYVQTLNQIADGSKYADAAKAFFHKLLDSFFGT